MIQTLFDAIDKAADDVNVATSGLSCVLCRVCYLRNILLQARLSSQFFTHPRFPETAQSQIPKPYPKGKIIDTT